MRLKKSIFSRSASARLSIAAAAGGLAILLALGLASQAEKPPTVAFRITTQEAPAALRSYAYYPEQLAALQSLGQFQPIADAGQKAAPQPVTLADAAKPTAGESKRRAEPTAKLLAATAVPGPIVVAPFVPVAAAAHENTVKIFGLPLPGAPNLPAAAELGGHVARLQDTAEHWRAAATDFGGRIASFWR
ncbi:hypothetical protein [Rhodoblastus sp.]|uniref:hypothetical protein n=1 Tax=Rhodoblastus sp. TaxID=1962975 RepID=UPI003F9E58D6